MKKRYNEEFKENAVRKVLKSEESISTIASQLGINQQTLRNWIKARSADSESSPSSSQLTADEWTEFQRLKKENVQLKKEREIMEKASKHSISTKRNPYQEDL